MKKTRISMFLMSMLAITSIASCNNGGGQSNSQSNSQTSDVSESSSDQTSGDVELISIALNKTQTSIMLESTETLTVTFNPANATDKELVWSSDDPTVASVVNGVVTANKIGSTTIKVASKSNANINASCAVTVTDNVVLTGVSSKAEFVSFENHKNKSSTDDDGFYDHEQTYKVGDDNKFNVKPVLAVRDYETLEPVSANNWKYDFEISATLEGQPAGAEYFNVVNARECDVKFTQQAVGKTFTISVVPGGIQASKRENFTRTITVDVIDGYNVYDPKEISYFDTRGENSYEDMPRMEDDNILKCGWYDFKVNNNLNTALHPSALIFQTDIKVTTADLPSNFFYTKAQADALGDSKAAGSLVDWAFLYEHTTNDGMTVEGNYFNLDLTEIPLVVRERAKKTEVGKVVSHAVAFRATAGTDIVFKNLNMSGNARNAQNAGDAALSGGFIFAKGSGCQSFDAYNIIATKFYITFMGDDPYTDDGLMTTFNLNKVKCFNNFNSFLYNWGQSIVATDSLFRSCGGPIVIQDHTGTDDYENKDNEGHYIGTETYGHVPMTQFVDCQLINYVAGSEAWFDQFGVTALVGQIKALSDLLYATGLPKSFIVDSNREGRLNAVLSAESKPAFFNFISVNKSGKSEGATSYPACGKVDIVNTGKHTTYDYRLPANDPVYQAYVALEVAKATPDTTPEQLAALSDALIAAATAKGITFTSQEEAIQKIGAYLHDKGTIHATFRALNLSEYTTDPETGDPVIARQAAPVIDLGEKFDLIGYDGINNYLQELPTIVAEMTIGGSPARYSVTPEQISAIPDYMALYYDGMMLVMGLTPYAA